MKSILISIRPKHTCNILNGIKWWEIRKKFPKDYIGWVYIYCTKNGALLFKEYSTNTYLVEEENRNYRPHYALNGKVVARFWCDKVEEQPANRPIEGYVFEQGCLTSYDILNYCGYKTFYAIHISNLEIFDKPKEISEFYKLGAWKVYEEQLDSSYMKRTEQEIMKSLGQTLTRAPQSWCYIEYE